MALLSDRLTIWEIGFRWAAVAERRWRLTIPLCARDHFRNLAGAILNGELRCVTIRLEEKPRLRDIEDCSAGRRFSRKLLKSALIERRELRLWCDRRGIALPEFWFAGGAQLDYEPRDDGPPGAYRVRMACQQIALEIWARQPARTIASIAKDNLVQAFGGARRYPNALVRQWLMQVAPLNASQPMVRASRSTSPFATVVAEHWRATKQLVQAFVRTSRPVASTR